MAIAFVGAESFASQAGAGDKTFGYACGAGADRLLVVTIAADPPTTDTITGVTYNGVAMTRAAAMYTADQGRNLYQYFLVAPATGENNIVVSHSSSDYVLLSAADYSGVAQTGQPDNVVTADSGGISVLTLSTALNPVAADSWIVLSEGGYDAAYATADTGCTRRAYESDYGGCTTFDTNGPVTDSHTMITDRAVGTLITHLLVSYAPAGGGGRAASVHVTQAVHRASSF